MSTSRRAWFVNLNGVDEVFCISFELPFALFQLVRAGSYHTAGTNWCLGNITKKRLAGAIAMWVSGICLPAGNSK